jgi:hypothetical protein
MENEKIIEIIKDYKNKSNKDLIYAMDTINTDFTKTKESLISLSHQLDFLEETYNKILEEYNKRTK